MTSSEALATRDDLATRRQHGRSQAIRVSARCAIRARRTGRARPVECTLRQPDRAVRQITGQTRSSFDFRPSRPRGLRAVEGSNVPRSPHLIGLKRRRSKRSSLGRRRRPWLSARQKRSRESPRAGSSMVRVSHGAPIRRASHASATIPASEADAFPSVRRGR
jgi:hypothetical protein